MLCKNPFVPAAGPAYGCGQCMPCRFNRRRVWTHRIVLEAAQYEANAFVNLTYSDDNIPEDGSLNPDDLQRWLKRLRKRVSPSRFRFFAVGEYGDLSERPHYHAGLFNFRSCAYGQSRYSARVVDCCYWCDMVRDTWGLGHVYLGSLEHDSAQYLAGYITKKMTAKDDLRLGGRYPEFARMSLRPGIGGDAMHDVADILLRYGRETDADVPMALRHGRGQLPLGRYLRRRLRQMVGKDGKISQAAMDELSQEMLDVRLRAKACKDNPSAKAHLIAANAGRVASVEGKAKLYKKERRL